MKYKLVYIFLIFSFGFLLRIRNILNPFLDYHSWRQTDTASVAYNYYKYNMNILHPRLNVFPEIRELEFHIYPWTVALLYKIFGFHDWIGRIVSIILGLCTMIFIYFIAKHFFNEKVALFSIFFLSCSPMMVYYNRCFMPESMALFFSSAGVYFFIKSISAKSLNIVLYFLSAIFLSFSILTKATMAHVLIPIIYMFLKKYKQYIYRDIYVWLFFIFALIPPILWYSYSHIVFVKEVGGESIWKIGTDKWFNKDILLNLDFYRKIWLQHLGELHFAYTGYLFFWVGFFSAKSVQIRFLKVWVYSVFLYFIVVAVGNYGHEYYQLPILTCGSIFVGYGMQVLREKMMNSNFFLKILYFIFILWLPIYGFTKSNERMRFDPSYKFAGESLLHISKEEDKILVFSDGEPEVLYYAKRKGWHFKRWRIMTVNIGDFINMGAKYVVYMGEEKKIYTSLKNLNLIPTLSEDEIKKVRKILSPFKEVTSTNQYLIFKLW